MSTVDEKNVLIVVDLQNCFIQGGSLGEKNANADELIKYYNLVKNIEKEITEKDYNLVVFSKDKHPINHSSLAEDIDPAHGVYPHHCRNVMCNCNKGAHGSTYFSKEAQEKVKDIIRGKNLIEGSTLEGSTQEMLQLLDNNKLLKDDILSEIDTLKDDATHEKREDPKTIYAIINPYMHQKSLKNLIEQLEKHINKKVIGLDLNYLFYATNLSDVIDKLNNGGDSEIGFATDICLEGLKDLEESTDYYPSFKTNISPVNGKYVTVPKGERCNYESYSAFNYHNKIKKNEESLTKKKFNKYDSSMNEVISLPAMSKYSTGLFEYIINFFNLSTDKNPITLNINVCGLVTNICVINTLQQGIALWNIVYSQKLKHVTCKFNLLDYISVPLKIDFPKAPHLHYPYSNSISSNNDDIKQQKQQEEDLKKLFIAKFEYDILQPNNMKILIGPIKSYRVLVERERFISLDLQEKLGGKKSIRNKARKNAVEKKSTTKKAVEKKSTTKKAAEKKSTTKKAAEKKSTTKKAVEKKSTTKKAAENKPATKKAVKKKSTTKKAAENKPATKKAEEKKPATKKAEEKKTCYKKSSRKETCYKKSSRKETCYQKA